MNLTTSQFNPGQELILHAEKHSWEIQERIFYGRRPFLHFSQIPQRLLTSDPGFPIFLRSQVQHQLPEWVFEPYLGGPVVRNCYWFESSLKPRNKHGLILLSGEETELSSWDEMLQRHDLVDARWLSLKPHNSQGIKWPVLKSLSLGNYLDSGYFPDLLVDETFGKNDTFTSLHMYYLWNLARFNTPQPVDMAPSLRIQQTYGNWCLLKVD